MVSSALMVRVRARAAAVGETETPGRRRISSLVARTDRWFVAVAAPCVSMSSPSNVGATGGGTVTIGGLGFGGLVVTPSASLGVADTCGSTAWTSATTVTCGPAAYGGSAVRTAVSVSAVAGTLMGLFSFDSMDACILSLGSLIPQSCLLMQRRSLALVASTTQTLQRAPVQR